jgi:hypothetical protein
MRWIAKATDFCGRIAWDHMVEAAAIKKALTDEVIEAMIEAGTQTPPWIGKLEEKISPRGITHEVAWNHLMGWNDKDQFFDREDWGLEPQYKPDGTKKKLWIPAGLIIPTVSVVGRKKEVIKMKVRRTKTDDNLPKYIAISGSGQGMSIYGNRDAKAVIVVESELDAYTILSNFFEDRLCVIATGTALKHIDREVYELVKDKKTLLICHDNDSAGIGMLHKWRKHFPRAEAYPVYQPSKDDKHNYGG